MDFHDQVRFGYQEPDDADATPVIIDPMIDDDDTTVLGYAAFVVVAPYTRGEQVTSVYPTRQAAAQAAEAEGYDPYMGDAEIDDEADALDHGTWPF